MGLAGSALKPLSAGADEQRVARTNRIVRKYMRGSVVRPAVSGRMLDESIARVWQRAASAGR